MVTDRERLLQILESDDQPQIHRITAAANLLEISSDAADIDIVLRTVETAIRGLREEFDARWSTPLVLAVSDLLVSLGKLTEAASLLLEAAQREHTTAGEAAVLLKRRGIIQEQRGEADDALQTLRTAASLAEDSGDTALQANLNNSLSIELLQLGRLDDAAQAADRAVQLAVDLRDLHLASAAMLTRGNVCMQSGQPLTALRHYHASLLNSGEIDDRHSEALLLTNIAMCYLQLGEILLFVDYICWALDTAIELDDRRNRALALANLAGVQGPLEARALYTEAWALFVHLNDLPHQTEVLFGLARAARRSDQPQDALHFARQSAEASAKMQNAELYAAAHGLIAELSADTGDAESAWNSYQTAWRALERLRRQTAAETVQLGLASSSQSYEDGALTLALQQALKSTDTAAETWTTRLSDLLELSRARVTADLIGRSTIAAVTLPDHVRDQLEHHRDAVRHHIAVLAAGRRTLPPHDPRLAEMSARLKQANQNLDEAFAFAEQSFPRYHLLEADDLTAELDLVRHQDANVAVIQYAAIDDRLISLTRAGGSAVVRVHGPLAEMIAIDHALTDLCERQQAEGRTGDLARRLYNLTFAPIEDAGILRDVSEIMVAPAPEVFGYPIESLHDGSGYLIERYTVTYVPGISIAAAAPPLPANHLPALIVADPDGTLPYARLEGATVADYLNSPFLKGGEATKDTVLQGVRDAVLIHIASHASFSSDAAAFSSIVLAGGQTNHRTNLGVDDIINLQLQPSLVVLSGCGTGRSSHRSSNEMIGFVRGFIASGASAVVASRWPVREGSTMQFMRNFYSQLIDNEAHPADALNAARQQHIALGYTHPGLWAPFSHFGTPPAWRRTCNQAEINGSPRTG
jgi:CHAT domain-containing protein/tetratricopeptide (TPR) repeat protein